MRKESERKQERERQREFLKHFNVAVGSRILGPVSNALRFIRSHRDASKKTRRVITVESGGVRGVVLDPGDDAMMAYGGTAGNGGAMGPSSGSADVLGSAGDYSPQSTPTPLTGHSTGSVENAYTPSGTGAASYSPQDSPASSAGGSGNGQLPSFGFTQDQVACVCEVSRVLYGFGPLLNRS